MRNKTNYQFQSHVLSRRYVAMIDLVINYLVVQKTIIDFGQNTLLIVMFIYSVFICLKLTTGIFEKLLKYL